jgi:hypothetical protein
MKRSTYNDMVQTHVGLPLGSSVICLCVTTRESNGDPYSICGKTLTKTQEGIQLCPDHMEEMHAAAHRHMEA